MEYFVLIDGELRSLIRNTLERVFDIKLDKKKSKTKNLLYKISIRVISSLIAVQIYKNLQENKDLKMYISYFFIIMFFLLHFDLI